jgi:hypothetical protein
VMQPLMIGLRHHFGHPFHVSPVRLEQSAQVVHRGGIDGAYLAGEARLVRGEMRLQVLQRGADQIRNAYGVLELASSLTTQKEIINQKQRAAL